jgi:hypothetical protein
MIITQKYHALFLDLRYHKSAPNLKLANLEKKHLRPVQVPLLFLQEKIWSSKGHGVMCRCTAAKLGNHIWSRKYYNRWIMDITSNKLSRCRSADSWWWSRYNGSKTFLITWLAMILVGNVFSACHKVRVEWAKKKETFVDAIRSINFWEYKVNPSSICKIYGGWRVSCFKWH